MTVLRALLIIAVVLHASFASAETVFTTDGSSNPDDRRYYYRTALLKLALDKTVEEYGHYQLNIVMSQANSSRVLRDVEEAVYPNYFTSKSVSGNRLERLLGVPFPVALGILGYRIAFIPQNAQSRMDGVKTLDDLRRMKVVQGLGWLDVQVLRHNGFIVREGTSYVGLFNMVARNHADLFFRGANELLDEWEAYKGIQNLAYDTKVALYYPLPRFFYTAKSNQEGAERVRKGLVAAYEDGSLVALWKQYFGNSVRFAGVGERIVFAIDNPFLKGVDRAYEKYLLTPGQIEQLLEQ